MGMGFSPSRKKRKVASADGDDLVAADPDQRGIENLRDVVSVSGVNLAEERERMLLLSTPKKDQLAPRKLREHEDGMVVEKTALRRKVAGIVERCGLRVGVERDVERCLAMCVEERMREIICSLIRESKQRVDWEESRHRCTVSTSDVRKEIMSLNERAKEEVQAAEARKDEKIEEEACEGSKGGKDKNGDDNDRMRRSTAAANVAARASLGGIDILAKWKLKADQLVREKRGGKDVNPKAALTVGRAMNDNVDADKRGRMQAGSVSAAGRAVGKFGRNGEAMTTSKPKVASTRSISVKDVIAVLEKEPQMSKATLMYLLMNHASR